MPRWVLFVVAGMLAGCFARSLSIDDLGRRGGAADAATTADAAGLDARRPPGRRRGSPRTRRSTTRGGRRGRGRRAAPTPRPDAAPDAGFDDPRRGSRRGLRRGAPPVLTGLAVSAGCSRLRVLARHALGDLTVSAWLEAAVQWSPPARGATRSGRRRAGRLVALDAAVDRERQDRLDHREPWRPDRRSTPEDRCAADTSEYFRQAILAAVTRLRLRCRPVRRHAGGRRVQRGQRDLVGTPTDDSAAGAGAVCHVSENRRLWQPIAPTRVEHRRRRFSRVARARRRHTLVVGARASRTKTRTR